MAYSQFTYPGYQPYYPQPVPDQPPAMRQNPWSLQNLQQPPAQVPPVQTAQLPSPQNGGMIWVNGKAEADGYQVLPGSAVALWDANNSVVYLRQADNTGKPSTKVYDLVERVEGHAQQTAPQIDLSKYITIEEAEGMIDRRVNDILAERLKRPAKANQKKEDTDNG